TGEHRVDARYRERGALVQTPDARMGMGAAQRLRPQHARPYDVRCVARGPGDLRAAIDSGDRPAYHLEPAHTRSPPLPHDDSGTSVSDGIIAGGGVASKQRPGRHVVVRVQI